MDRDSFVFYRSFFEAIDVCPIENQRNIYRAIAAYALKGELPDLEGVEAAIFFMAKPQLDSNTKKYLNALKGGAPKGNENARKKDQNVDLESAPKSNNQKTTKKQPKNNQAEMLIDFEDEQNQANDNETDNENDNENNNDNRSTDQNKRKTAKRFSPPSLEDVKKFILENNLCVDAEIFIDYYQSNGWMVGRGKMKDWQATLRNWDRRERSNKTPQTIQRVEDQNMAGFDPTPSGSKNKEFSERF